MRLFRKFLEEENKGELEDLTNEELPSILLDFYAALRMKNADYFKISTLKSIHSGINRFMKEQRSVDIVSDPRFICANEMFKGVKVQSKKNGKEITSSKTIITEPDMSKIAAYFDYDHMNHPDPRKLQ